MAYARKKTFAKRKTYRRRRYVKRQYPRRSWYGARPELKKLDGSNSGNTISSTGTVYNISQVAIGSGPDNRVGNQIRMKYFFGHFNLNLGTGATNPQKVRMMLIRDKQQVSDTAPTVTNVLGGANVNLVLNVETLGRFQILYDKFFTLSTNSPIRHFNIKKRLWSYARYNGALSSDIQKGGLYMLVISDDPAGATNPKLYSSYRLSFIDV